MTEPNERLVTHVTTVRPLICVYAAVSRQMTELSERLATDITALRSLICVYAAVTRHMTEPSERLVTNVTAARPLIGVHAAVSRQTIETGERLATVVTSVRLLSRVGDKMVSQMIPRVRGVLATLTHVLAVPADVAVMVLHVFVQMVLSQTCEVAVYTADHGVTCQRQSYTL